MTVIGLFGIIGTVEYSHAIEFKEIDLGEILENCDNGITILNLNDHYILNNTGEGDFKNAYLVFEKYNHIYSEHDHSIHITPQDYWYFVPTLTHDFSTLGDHFLTSYNMKKPVDCNNFKHTFRVVHNESTSNDQRIINLIADTFNLTPTNKPSNQDKIDRLEKRYNTCFENKENIKTERDSYQSELSELQSSFDILQSNNTEYKFTVEKLKQEKADLIKQFEEVETELIDAQNRIKELEG